jgi:hypothetical protein
MLSRRGFAQAAGSPEWKRRRGSRCRPTLDRLESLLLLSGDPILHWNQVALDAMAADTLPGTKEQVGPTSASRAMAIVHLAMFDAVNAIIPLSKSYVLSETVPRWASAEAAVAQAAHDTLSALYPRQKPAFDAELRSVLRSVPNGMAQRVGVDVGRRAARVVLRARQNDGSERVETYQSAVEPGNYLVYPEEPAAVTPHWGKVRPFALNSVDQFPVAPPPDLTTVEYAQAYNEVQELGGDGLITPTSRTEDQTIIGTFWGYDGTPGLGYPPRLYNQIARAVAIQQGTMMVENARLFALVNVALADAGIASWHVKYDTMVWRPLRGIRQVGPNGESLDDGNPLTTADPNFTPLGAPCTNHPTGASDFTPPFPAYTSGHATFGAAALGTLRNFFGRDDLTFTVVSDEYNGQNKDRHGNVRPFLPRTFDSFSEAIEENGQSRIYLGIHWSFDKTEGIKQGEQIANFVSSTCMNVRPHRVKLEMQRLRARDQQEHRSPPRRVPFLNPAVARAVPSGPLASQGLDSLASWVRTGRERLQPARR